MLEELGLAYEVIPVDTSKGEQHAPGYRAMGDAVDLNLFD
jgi:GSH-dependent disulfide-bond oxidoreductase